MSPDVTISLTRTAKDGQYDSALACFCLGELSDGRLGARQPALLSRGFSEIGFLGDVAAGNHGEALGRMLAQFPPAGWAIDHIVLNHAGNVGSKAFLAWCAHTHPNVPAAVSVDALRSEAKPS